MVIYRITNTTNDKVYIGKTVATVERRWAKHIQDARCPKVYFHFAIQRHGASAFKIDEIDHTETKVELNRLEIFYIKKYKSYLPEFGYNETMGGDGGNWTKEGYEKWLAAHLAARADHPWKGGRKWTKAEKKRIRAQVIQYNKDHPGQKRPKETGERISRALKGHKVSKHIRAKIARSLRGGHMSEEARAKMSASQRARFAIHPVVITPEMRVKISNTLRGRKASKQARANQSAAQIRRQEMLRVARALLVAA
jgi:group I intron endonuclease